MTAPTGLDAWAACQENRCARGFAPEHHPRLCTPTHSPVDIAPAPTSEWDLFTAALRASVGADGLIHQSDMRPKIRGRISPKTIASFYARARGRKEGLLAEAGHERSDDEAGRNAGRMEPIYAYLHANTQRSAA